MNDYYKGKGVTGFFQSINKVLLGFVKIFFPIEKSEIKKYLPLAMMMFIVLFNYTILRTLKDGFFVTHVTSGAETLNYLKGVVVLPCSILFVIFYSVLMNSVKKKQNVFYYTIAPFIIFNLVFIFFLYPNRDFLHPSMDTIVRLQTSYPMFKWLMPIYGLWIFSMFYFFSELWGSFGMSMLFWQFANKITKTSQSKRFYVSFGVLGNIGFSMASYILSRSMSGKISDDVFDLRFKYIIVSVTILMVVLAGIYWGINKYIVSSDPELAEKKPVNSSKKKKKPSLRESFRVVFSSKYLGLIMLLIFCYNSMMNLVEVTWKSQMRSLYPIKSDYTAAYAGVQLATGVSSIIMFALGNYIVSKFSWSVAASITPVVMVSTGVLFFFFVVFESYLSPLASLFSVGPGFLAFIFGAIQNVSSKSTKYSLFDPTKEMTYIPLDEDLKSQGKAAVDVAGSRISKSFGGWLQSALLMIVPGSSQFAIAPYLMVVILLISVLWFVSIKMLSKEYSEKVQES
ncbi:Npt1/Npt2 family nucleotide transporter [Candidatus Nesciobacter abundans]|uniref:ADP,ATP carrier protein n=1 Tax=Candidatus Nesciobacter abundans TaxID=2601668 RepID=A0A5C0UK86_9PROT|nr:Npt1/Npt2 family nucleotide transporter [Candidatus Nesciobacter abundans]QEK39274.1 NTP/NDP exchange transporter [Candidatus Nesciobacter abundans]